MSNRVEELESHVAELQATVDGLTEELVETRERLRSLEEDADDAADVPGVRSENVTPRGDENGTTAATDDPEAEADAEDAPDESDPATDDGAPSEADSDDIIVA